MNTSAFNRNIIFEKKTTTTNAIGTPIENWVFMKESWANFRLLSGQMQITENAGLPTSDVEFVVRYDPTIDYNCQIKMEGHTYQIQHIFTENRKDYTRIRCNVYNEDQ